MLHTVKSYLHLFRKIILNSCVYLSAELDINESDHSKQFGSCDYLVR